MANVSEDYFMTNESVQNISQDFPSFQRSPAVSIASVIVAWVTGVTGICANGVVLVVLVY